MSILPRVEKPGTNDSHQLLNVNLLVTAVGNGHTTTFKSLVVVGRSVSGIAVFGRMGSVMVNTVGRIVRSIVVRCPVVVTGTIVVIVVNGVGAIAVRRVGGSTIDGRVGGVVTLSASLVVSVLAGEERVGSHRRRLDLFSLGVVASRGLGRRVGQSGMRGHRCMMSARMVDRVVGMVNTGRRRVGVGRRRRVVRGAGLVVRDLVSGRRFDGCGRGGDGSHYDSESKGEKHAKEE